MQSNSYIKNPDGTPTIGQVWPNDAIFPDFFTEIMENLWKSWLYQFSEVVPFSGIWLEMNEIETFSNGTQPKSAPPSDP